MIFRTVVEEIVVRTDAERKTLQFIVHWKGDTHTQITMEWSRSATDCATSMEALDVIRRMAVRHSEDQIASVLNWLPPEYAQRRNWTGQTTPLFRPRIHLHQIPLRLARLGCTYAVAWVSAAFRWRPTISASPGCNIQVPTTMVFSFE